ncbi:MAG: short-chain dehydrogenase [Lysobacterales bacterium CG02_land_8_20_14_3_00_62_12]|nr:MAG: short-chain dehydrogenase [Xanthomonadales bacterium CG02_land_8_20_14_3_00_62_12]
MSRAAASDDPRCLCGRVVLITGAAGGFGQATALAAALAGATVILCGRRVRPLEKIYDQIVADGGLQPAIYPIDLEGATPADYQQLAQSITEHFGKLDGLVHAAAHFGGLMAHADAPIEDWLRSLQVNLTSPQALTQACLPLLQQSADAAVIFLLDDLDRVGKAHWGAYGVAQFARRGLLSQWAAELDHSTLRVHGLLPQPMRTPLRARAYFAEDPSLIESPAAAAAACVRLLSAAGRGDRGQIQDLTLTSPPPLTAKDCQ